MLSGCETGLGELSASEGVLGLRRAFALAGADSLVMSLWSVPDQRTRQLMEEMYERILHRRRPVDPVTALREAQLDILRENLRNGDAAPWEWGAFVVSGVGP